MQAWVSHVLVFYRSEDRRYLLLRPWRWTAERLGTLLVPRLFLTLLNGSSECEDEDLETDFSVSEGFLDNGLSLIKVEL